SGIRLIGREGRVGWAEVWARAGGVEAAAPAVGKTIGATGGAVDKAGVRCLLGHLEFPFEIDLEKTGGNAEIAESKGIAEKATRKLVKIVQLQIDGDGQLNAEARRAQRTEIRGRVGKR